MNKNQKRVKEIYDMLFEMACGNFAYRLKTSNGKDNFDQAIEILNQAAEVLNNSFSEVGNDAPKYIFRMGLHPLLTVKNNSDIISFRAQLQIQLGYEIATFQNLPLQKILSKESQRLFNDFCTVLDDSGMGRKNIKLVFLDSRGMQFHYYCTLERHLPGDLIVISSISNKTEAVINKFDSDNNSILLKIQRVYDFIMDNLQNPLPTTKELSEMFGINEVLIKSEFRKTFNTSIYKLYTDERLKFALDLIQNTDDSLTSVASQSGFTAYITFYKAFRKKYLCSPTEVERNVSNE